MDQRRVKKEKPRKRVPSWFRKTNACRRISSLSRLLKETANKEASKLKKHKVWLTYLTRLDMLAKESYVPLSLLWTSSCFTLVWSCSIEHAYLKVNDSSLTTYTPWESHAIEYQDTVITFETDNATTTETFPPTLPARSFIPQTAALLFPSSRFLISHL